MLFFLIFKGYSSNQACVFRSFYERPAELRSMVFKKVSIVALTTTSTVDTITFIIENLCMYDTKMRVATPERSNLTYLVHSIESREPLLFLSSIIKI